MGAIEQKELILVICLLIGAGACLIAMHIIAKSMGGGNVKK